MAKKHRVKRSRTPAETARQLDPRVRECVAWGLLIFLFALWQATPRGFVEIGGARPLPLTPLVASIAMFAGPVGGGAAGVAAGLLWDLYSTRLFGFHALILLAIGVAVGLLVRLLLRNNPLSALLLTVGATAAQGIFDWLCNYLLTGRADALYLLWHTLLPNMLYTAVLSLPIYALVRGLAKMLKLRG